LGTGVNVHAKRVTLFKIFHHNEREECASQNEITFVATLEETNHATIMGNRF